MINKYKKFWTALAVFIAFSGFVLYMGYKEEKNLFSHKSITTATVTQVERQRNSSDIFVRYKFRAREINYAGVTGVESHDRTEDAKYLRRILVGKHFPVLYDSLDPDNSKLLLEKKEYTKFAIKRPDSLRRYFVIVDSIGDVQD